MVDIFDLFSKSTPPKICRILGGVLLQIKSEMFQLWFDTSKYVFFHIFVAKNDKNKLISGLQELRFTSSNQKSEVPHLVTQFSARASVDGARWEEGGEHASGWLAYRVSATQLPSKAATWRNHDIWRGQPTASNSKEQPHNAVCFHVVFFVRPFLAFVLLQEHR